MNGADVSKLIFGWLAQWSCKAAGPHPCSANKAVMAVTVATTIDMHLSRISAGKSAWGRVGWDDSILKFDGRNSKLTEKRHISQVTIRFYYQYYQIQKVQYYRAEERDFDYLKKKICHVGINEFYLHHSGKPVRYQTNALAPRKLFYLKKVFVPDCSLVDCDYTERCNLCTMIRFSNLPSGLSVSLYQCSLCGANSCIPRRAAVREITKLNTRWRRVGWHSFLERTMSHFGPFSRTRPDAELSLQNVRQEAF